VKYIFKWMLQSCKSYILFLQFIVYLKIKKFHIKTYITSTFANVVLLVLCKDWHTGVVKNIHTIVKWVFLCTMNIGSLTFSQYSVNLEGMCKTSECTLLLVKKHWTSPQTSDAYHDFVYIDLQVLFYEVSIYFFVYVD